MFQVTPEHTFVVYSFESILIGLLSLVLALGIYRHKRQLDPANLGFLLAALILIRKSANRVSRIIRNFLDCARPHSLKSQRDGVNMVVQEAVKLAILRRTRESLSLIRRLRSSLLISFDRNRTPQVTANLINKSVDARREGGRAEIATEDQLDQSAALITGQDNDSGIQTNNMVRVFDAFFTTRNAGARLGFLVSYATAQNHCGNFTAETEKGRGTSFSSALPIGE